MQVGDLVRSRGTNGIPQNEFGIIIADKGLSWQKDNMMWLVEWSDGSWCVLHEYNLEAEVQVGDLVKNYYKEVGTIIEEWVDEEKLYYERQYYVLYSNGKMVVTSEYDLEVVCK